MGGSVTIRMVIMLGLSLAAASTVGAQSAQRALAFPGAEGFGRFAAGGRSGDV